MTPQVPPLRKAEPIFSSISRPISRAAALVAIELTQRYGEVGPFLQQKLDTDRLARFHVTSYAALATALLSIVPLWSSILGSFFTLRTRVLIENARNAQPRIAQHSRPAFFSLFPPNRWVCIRHFPTRLCSSGRGLRSDRNAFRRGIHNMHGEPTLRCRLSCAV